MSIGMQEVIKEILRPSLPYGTISLEDALLRALYAYEKEVAVTVLAGWLGISENAVISIVNRIRKSHPHFIMITKEEEHSKAILHFNKGVEREVLLFLEQGGFTALNEKERKAYEQALIRETKQGRLAERSARQHPLKKAVALIAITTGLITLLVKVSKKSKNKL